jgi:hypothetical protein
MMFGPYDIPIAPGLPPLLRTAEAAAEQIFLLQEDTLTDFGLSLAPTWGVYDLFGAPVVVADTVTALDFHREWAIADYPIERGGFESYDKVDVPFVARVRFAAGGSAENRAALLNSVSAIAGDLNLYDIATPEKIYTSVNVQRYDFSRTAHDGVGLLQIDLWLLEVRVTAGASDGNAQSPSGDATVNGGNVQAGSDVAPTQSSIDTAAAQQNSLLSSAPLASGPADLTGGLVSPTDFGALLAVQ